MYLIESLDENLQPIGTLSLEEIHSKGLLHRSIHILVINNKGEIFIRKRSSKKKLYPGVLSSSVGAHVLKNQTPEECAKVNLKSFLNLDLPLEKIGEGRVKDEIENEHIVVFLCKSEKVKNLNPDESDEGQFMNIDEVKELINQKQTTPHLAKALKFIENYKSKS